MQTQTPSNDKVCPQCPLGPSHHMQSLSPYVAPPSTWPLPPHGSSLLSCSYLQNVDTGETIGCPDPPPSSTTPSTTPTVTVETIGGLLTTPSSCNGLTAVAAVGSLFVVATVILGGILAALVVLFINDRRGRYGRSQSGKTLQPQLSVEVHTNDSALQ